MIVGDLKSAAVAVTAGWNDFMVENDDVGVNRMREELGSVEESPQETIPAELAPEESLVGEWRDSVAETVIDESSTLTVSPPSLRGAHISVLLATQESIKSTNKPLNSPKSMHGSRALEAMDLQWSDVLDMDAVKVESHKRSIIGFLRNRITSIIDILSTKSDVSRSFHRARFKEDVQLIADDIRRRYGDSLSVENQAWLVGILWWLHMHIMPYNQTHLYIFENISAADVQSESFSAGSWIHSRRGLECTLAMSELLQQFFFGSSSKSGNALFTRFWRGHAAEWEIDSVRLNGEAGLILQWFDANLAAAFDMHGGNSLWAFKMLASIGALTMKGRIWRNWVISAILAARGWNLPVIKMFLATAALMLSAAHRVICVASDAATHDACVETLLSDAQLSAVVQQHVVQEIDFSPIIWNSSFIRKCLLQ